MSKTHYETIIVGSGFAGLCAGIKLKEKGLLDFVILEQASDVGGTWRDNHYPGAACDVPSHLYSFSFEPNAAWSRKYGTQREILDYLRQCAKKHGLYERIRFNTRASNGRYDQEHGLWHIDTEQGSRLTCRSLVFCKGGMSRAALPDIKGLQDFKGAVFHSARWDHATPLEGKRVGVIGTGASAIQIVPSIVNKVAQMTVFQRTAAWIFPKDDRSYSPLEVSLKTRFPLWERAIRQAYFLRGELLGNGLRFPGFMRSLKPLFIKHLHKQVQDLNLRAKLTPDYLPGCKRILLSNDFYPAMTQKHVSLVTDGIDHITKDGVVTKDGKKHELDVLILATGFVVAETVAPFPLAGLGGVDLNESWAAEGPQAYRGTTVAGYPNMFIIIGPNTGLGHTSMVLMIEAQVGYAVDAIERMHRQGIKSLEVDADKQGAYNRQLQEQLATMVWAKGGCVSWYHTSGGRNTTLWPRSTMSFAAMLREFDIASYKITMLHDGKDQRGQPGVVKLAEVTPLPRRASPG